jgi:hypothetical protein
MSSYKRHAGLLGLALVVTLLLGIAPAEEKSQEQLVFSMLAQHVGTGRSGQTPVTITIERLNTPDERDALEEIFIDRGM